MKKGTRDVKYVLPLGQTAEEGLWILLFDAFLPSCSEADLNLWMFVSSLNKELRVLFQNERSTVQEIDTYTDKFVLDE